MGHLIYAGATEYAIEDRMLAHVKAAMAAKLRRQECFLLSWEIEPQHGAGRVSLWIAPAIPIQLRFAGSRVPDLNPAWLEALVETGNSPRGMVLMGESDAVRYLEQARARAAELTRHVGR